MLRLPRLNSSKFASSRLHIVRMEGTLHGFFKDTSLVEHLRKGNYRELQNP